MTENKTTKSNFLHLLPYSCLILYRTLRLCMHSSFRLFITVFSSPAHFSPTLLELYASSPPTLISLYSSPQLFYHCIHPNNLFFTAFISSTLISLYSSLQLLYHYIPFSTFFITLFIFPAHFHRIHGTSLLSLYLYLQLLYRCIHISNYLPLFYSPNLKLLFHVCLRCSSFTGCCVL